MKIMSRIGILSAIVFFSFTQVGGCGGGGSSSSSASTSNTYAGTQSPGDYWTWTIDPGAGNFIAMNETTGFDYAGTVVSLPSGFLKLTVTFSTDPDTAENSVGYALEFPGVAVLVKPADADGALITAAITGANPAAGSYEYNWVVVPNVSGDESSDTAYGNASLTIDAASSMDVTTTRFQLDGDSNGGHTDEGFLFSDGVATKPGEDVIIVATPSGMLVADNGPGGSEAGFAGMIKPASDVDFDMSGKEFRGFTFRAESVSNNTTPIWVTGINGEAEGGEWSDIEAGIKDVKAVDITFDSQDTPGIIKATLISGGETLDLVIMFTEIEEKLVGLGMGNELSDPPYNVFFIEQ